MKRFLLSLLVCTILAATMLTASNNAFAFMLGARIEVEENE